MMLVRQRSDNLATIWSQWWQRVQYRRETRLKRCRKWHRSGWLAGALGRPERMAGVCGLEPQALGFWRPMLYQLSYTPAARWSGAFIEGVRDRQSPLPPVLCSATMHAPLHPPIPVETLLLAYRSGIFPMADRREDNEVFWVEPRERAILPLGGLHISKSLRKVLRADRFTVTLDRDFEQVIRACAEPREDHPETWISERIVQATSRCTAPGTPIRSNAGKTSRAARRCWSAGSMACRLTGCSAARACSAAGPMPARSHWHGWWRC